MIAEYMALTAEHKTQLLSQTAARMGVDPVIVEKDLWVSAVLSILFTHPEMKDRFIFQGGTSLSKVYGAIQRFSNSVDQGVVIRGPAVYTSDYVQDGVLL